jgi:hypothetical protein
MSTAQKIDATVSYYQSFSRGLAVAAEMAVQIKPELATAVNAAMQSVKVFDRAVNVLALLLENNAEVDKVEEQLKIVDGAAQAANAAIGAVVQEESALQSFFDGSMFLLTALGRTCEETVPPGTCCHGQGIS